MKHLPHCKRIKVISSVYTNLISKDWQMVGAIKAKTTTAPCRAERRREADGFKDQTWRKS